MKIAVTGNAGFIASHITDKYRALGHTVIDIDNRHAKPVDINDAEAVMALFMKEKPQVVNHHAAIAEILKSVREPIPAFRTNVLGTINVLMAAGACGTVKKFIFSSTSALYGDPKKLPVTEAAPMDPLSPYGLSKYMGEEAIKFYAKLFGFEYLIFRYPNVYGPRQDPKGEAGVVAIFTGLMREGKQPTIYGEDIVRANVIALKKGKNEILNLGWGAPVTDQTIFDELAKNLGFKKKPIYAPYRKGEVYKTSLSPKKALAVIGWEPKIPFALGVKRHIKETAPRS
jgi:UDP-glucose 4-epimerase